MGLIDRTHIPENFYDWTSTMLLAQPEPQYFYTQMWRAALNADLMTPDAIGNPGRELPAAGAPYSPADRDRLILAEPLMSETMGAKVDFNAEPGHTVRLNRPLFANTTYTQASRFIGSNQTISTTPIAVGSEQTTLTLGRFAGPYDATNSRVAPYGIDRLDASVGVHKLSSVVGTHLKRDLDRTIDSFFVTLLDLGTAVYPSGMTAVNDATIAGALALDYETISRAEQLADTANAPTYPDGYRALVLTPLQVNQLRNDSQYARSAKDHPQYNILFPGYVSSVNKLHIFKSTTLNITNNSSSIPIHYGHLICPGVLGTGMGWKPEVVAASDDNYKQTVKVIWIMAAAFGLLNNTLVWSVRSSA